MPVLLFRELMTCTICIKNLFELLSLVPKAIRVFRDRPVISSSNAANLIFLADLLRWMSISASVLTHVQIFCHNVSSNDIGCFYVQIDLVMCSVSRVLQASDVITPLPHFFTRPG